MPKHAAPSPQTGEPAAPRLTRRELRIARQKLHTETGLSHQHPVNAAQPATEPELSSPAITSPSTVIPFLPTQVDPVDESGVGATPIAPRQAELSDLPADLTRPQLESATPPLTPLTVTPEAEPAVATLLFSGLSPLTPLHQDQAAIQDSAPATASHNGALSGPTVQPKSSFINKLSSISALAGTGALIFTFSLPGVQTISTESDSQLAANQQSFHTGDASQGSDSFDALNVVNVEPGEDAGSFSNFLDAAVQYPFAHTVALTDPFGERSFPVSGFHDAQDFAAPAGTPVQVIADGTVTEAGITTDGCGFGLKVTHQIADSTVTSRYCHMQMNSHELSVGDQVKVGDHAGLVGNTGLSFGPHLHFVITVDGEAIDPMPFLLQHNRETRPQR